MSKKRKHFRDAKEEVAERKRKARKRRRAWFLVFELLIFIVLLGLCYVMHKYGKITTDVLDDIQINKGVSQEDYTTIALFGSDSREGKLDAGVHADTIMVVSINEQTKDIKIISVYRDTLMRQEKGELKKANSAYHSGGPSEALNMLNRNLDLDIQDYVTIDFKALSDVIDSLGGIEVELSSAEAAEINNYIQETAAVAGKEAITVSEGVQNLDGVQAVTYARIRKNVGGDYARAERQQVVIKKVVEKLKETDLSTINEIIDEVFSQVSTSFTLSEIVKLAAGVTKYNIVETGGFPFELTDSIIQEYGSIVIPLGHVENVEELHEFLYSKKDYTVSETVQEIAAEIEAVTGYTRADIQSGE